MSTFLCVLLAVVCAADAIATDIIPMRRRVIAGFVIATLLCVPIAMKTLAEGRIYRSQTPLNLPGAKRIRLPHEDAANYQWVVANLRAECDTFVSLPGINSLYLWTGLEPPTKTNVTTWMTLLDDSQQRAIADRLLRARRSCVVVTDYGYWLRGQELSKKPLMGTIRNYYVPQDLSTGTFAILGRRSAAPATKNYLLYGEHRFDGDDEAVAAPAVFLGRDPLSLNVRFRTNGGGVLVSLQDDLSGRPSCHLPMMYVGTDGFLYAQARTGPPRPLRSLQRIADGRWHEATLTSQNATQRLVIDGAAQGDSMIAERRCGRNLKALIGSGYIEGFPAAPRGRFRFGGTIGEVSLVATRRP